MKLLFALAFAALVGVQDSPAVYAPGDGVSLPQVTKQVKAEYTAEAMQNRIEGKVGDVKVTESLDTIYGLDRNAVAAMKQWEFKPGMKDGKAVAVRVHVLINFTLK